MTTSEFSFKLAGSVRHQGLPVSGITVFAYKISKPLSNQGLVDPQQVVAWQKTGTKGEFNLAVKAGIYGLEIRSSGNRFLNESITSLSVTANTNCNISLSTGYVVTGKVVTNDGTKIFQGTVVAQEVGSSAYCSVAKVEDGRFNIVLPRGDYNLAYRSIPMEDFGPPSFDTTNALKDELKGVDFIAPAYLACDLTMLPVRQDSRVEIVLPSLVRLAGKILDHKRMAVADAVVMIKPSNPLGSTLFKDLGLMSKGKSDEEGNFQFFVQPGTYDFTLTPSESSSLFALTEDRVNIYENCDKQFNLEEGCLLDGKILHQGKPTSFCSATIFDGADQFSLSIKSDRQGRFRTTLPKGSYKVLAREDEELGQRIVDQNRVRLGPAIREVVIKGQTSIEIDLDQALSVFGKVVDESRRPRIGVSISAFVNEQKSKPIKELGRKSEIVLDNGITDGEGDYRLSLARGNYLIVANNDFSNAKFIEVADDHLELDFILAGWRQLALEILGEDGMRIPSCRLSYAPYMGSNSFPEMHKYENVFASQLARGSLLAGNDGMVKTVLPSGIYTIEIAPPKESAYDGKLIRQLSLNSDLNRRIILPLKNRLTKATAELRLI